MSLSDNHIQHVCLFGQQGQCRYLDQDTIDYTKFVCKKKSHEKKVIDEEVKEFFTECADKNVDPFSTGEPVGDNCKGYLPFLDMPQGYDVDKK